MSEAAGSPQPADLDPVVNLTTDIGWPDSDAERSVREQLSGAGLGRLAELGAWLAGVQTLVPPRTPARPRLLYVSTGAEAPALSSGLADVAGVGVRTIALPGGPESMIDAVAAGAAAVDAEVESGADLLLVADPADADEVAALTAISLLTSLEPVRVVGTSSDRSDADWMTTVAAVRDRRRSAVYLRSEHQALLAALGSPHLAALTGVLLRAAARRTPVVLDGPQTAAAALLAREASARAIRWWAAGHRAASAAHTVALDRLHLEPVMDLDLNRTGGIGALLALGPLRAAISACADTRLPEPEPDSAQ